MGVRATSAKGGNWYLRVKSPKFADQYLTSSLDGNTVNTRSKNVGGHGIWIFSHIGKQEVSMLQALIDRQQARRQTVVDVTAITKLTENKGNGKFFLFTKAAFETTFGTFKSGSTVDVKQCRGGVEQWFGTVKYWENDDGVHGRRTSGAASGQWAVGDTLGNVDGDGNVDPYAVPAVHAAQQEQEYRKNKDAVHAAQQEQEYRKNKDAVHAAQQEQEYRKNKVAIHAARVAAAAAGKTQVER